MNSHDIMHMDSAEIQLSSSDFDTIAELALREFGLSLPKSKQQLVQSRLARRIRALGLSNFSSYRSVLDGPNGKSEQTSLLSALTTNVTKFFREIHHFEDLLEHEMPRLTEAARNGNRVRIWSAACSSGQEAFSIALSAMRYSSDIGDYDFKILATDIDPEILKKARDGIYSHDEINGISNKFYSPSHVTLRPLGEKEKFSVNEEVRKLIKFRELNLISDLPFKGSFDVIFCRNVAIYFDPSTQNSVWRKLSSRLREGGKLYIGHSERIRETSDLNLIPTGITTYKKSS